MPALTATGASSSPASSPHKKFNTLSALSHRSSNVASANEDSKVAASPKKTGVKGLFDPISDSENTSLSSRNMLGNLSSNAVVREDGPWSISVADASLPASDKRDARKKFKSVMLHTYTLYITTPTHNLTLLRSSNDITELHSRLRDSHSSSTAFPSLPTLPSASVPSSRKLLQTISRTLSPSGVRNRSALSSLTATSANVNETATSTPPSPAKSPAQASAPLSPNAVDNKEDDSHSTTTRLATYFTAVANIPSVRKHKAWKRFIRVGAEDLQSVRVERRVRKVRSDLAQHVKSSVAPANTNVAVTPSQSDIGEENAKDDDERSLSGQSTSQSMQQDGVLTSENKENRDSPRKGTQIAGIPEENERLPNEAASNSRQGNAANGSSGGRRRERKHRKAPDSDKVTVDEFDMIRVLGKGCAGKVLLVRHKPSNGLFAMKSIHKRHVLAHQELQHTLTEQAVLKRMAREVTDPFVVKLWWSFHDLNNLYLVMDFHPGGDLATQLSRWGRLGRDRARFYAAEIVEGVEGLHRAGVVYRDLKPENVLIGVDGHIVLSDFGLSKEFPVPHKLENSGSSTPPPGSPSGSKRNNKGQGSHWLSASEDNQHATSSVDSFSHGRSRWADVRDTTTTFCGTAEYLAPEVIQGNAYSYEVDWWSFGTMLYEMLTGITPFWADTHADMYVRVLHDDLVFPDDRVLDQDTKSIVRGLLQRNPMLRMKEPRIKKHPYFSMIEWDHVFHKRYIPPYIPPINPLDELDTQNFDETFLDMKPVINGGDDGEEDKDGDIKVPNSGTKEADTVMAHRTASDGKSLFDGYSFRGRRDSESVQSTILSYSAPSEPEAVDSEDDDAAARAAVAALDHLEREAAESEAALSSPSQLSASTHPTSFKGSDDAGKQNSRHTQASSSGLPAEPIAETEKEEEDDDWDMVDAATAGEPIHSEINGGKGQNLFARGVVDTYRLLRRQESSRLPMSSGYATRPFNRLARRQRGSVRDLKARNAAAGNSSAVSLGSRSATEIVPDESPATERDNHLAPPNSAPLGETDGERKAASPSLASSDDVALQDKLNKQRIKKMKRFTKCVYLEKR